MDINEHVVTTKDGTVKGLYTLDIENGSFAHKDLWSRIDQIIYEYYQLHPLEMEILVAENKQLSDGQLRKFGLGASKDMELRYHMRVPVGLLKTLEAFEPTLFENRAYYHKFLNRYKGLRACNI